MEDITPKLLEAIQNDFQSQFNKSKTIQGLYAKIRDGTATYEEANEFAIETGRLLSASFQKNLSEDILPDGRMYYNIANRVLGTTLTNNHRLITGVTSKVQTSLNKAAGIGIKAIVPDVNESRIMGLVNKVSSAAEFSTVAWLFDEPVVNFSQSIVDDAIRTNAEFQYKSGLSPKIARKEVGNCCDWCKEVVGSYEYPDVPVGVYKRHRYCRCTVAYEAGKYATDVHTKREYDSGDVKARIENSRAFQERMGIESQRQKAERKRQAKLQAWKEETLKKQQKESRIEYAKNGGKTAKPLANAGGSGKITLADINKMITPYEKKVLDAVPKKDGYFDIAAHGATNYIEYGESGKIMSARELANIIKRDPTYNGEKIRLLSCDTGATDDGFAQDLANALGVEVEAPNDVLLVAPNGKFEVGYNGSGKMVTFKPGNKGRD